VYLASSRALVLTGMQTDKRRDGQANRKDGTAIRRQGFTDMDRDEHRYKDYLASGEFYGYGRQSFPTLIHLM
jgi:hypothetical protein